MALSTDVGATWKRTTVCSPFHAQVLEFLMQVTLATKPAFWPYDRCYISKFGMRIQLSIPVAIQVVVVSIWAGSSRTAWMKGYRLSAWFRKWTLGVACDPPHKGGAEGRPPKTEENVRRSNEKGTPWFASLRVAVEPCVRSCQK